MIFVEFLRTPFLQSTSGRLLLTSGVNFRYSEQTPEVFVKKVFFKILQNLQENTCVGISFKYVAYQGLRNAS